MILGSLRGRMPFVTASVELPRLHVVGRINFLIDTGAIQTVIHPADWSTMLVDLDGDFRGSTVQAAQGIGGNAYEYVEPCRLVFLHDDGEPEELALNISLALRTDYNGNFPSLMGTDVLGEYKLTYHLAENLVSLE